MLELFYSRGFALECLALEGFAFKPGINAIGEIQPGVFAEQLAGGFVVRLGRGDLVVETAEPSLNAIFFNSRNPTISPLVAINTLEA